MRQRKSILLAGVRTTVFGALLLGGANTAAAQAPAASGGAPYLEGRVHVDPAEGVLDVASCLSGFEPAREIRFLLNRALNVKSVATREGVILDYEGETTPVYVGDGREYAVVRPDTDPPLDAVCVEYRGAVPVYESNTATVDWKGRIAAGFGTLRAAEQTRWYPSLHDPATGRVTTDVSYALDVACPTCQAIYLNGSPPVRGAVGRFESATPRPLLLYAGRFDFRETDRITFVGGAASDGTAAVFSRLAATIGDLYASLLGDAYEERPVLLSFNSVSRRYPPGQVSWQFVTWPTITFSGGLDFDAFVEPGSEPPGVPPWLVRSLSHEMAHFYFGTRYMPHGPLFWFALESTAEYLSLVATHELLGELALAEYLMQFPREIGEGAFPALSEVREPSGMSGAHYYRLAPAQLLMLESAVGRGPVVGLLRGLLAQQADEPIDQAALQRIAAAAGITAAPYDRAFEAGSGDVRAFAVDRAHRALAAAAADGPAPPALRLAAALAEADTTRAGRLQVISAISALAERAPDDMSVRYAIGRMGAVTGLQLDLAAASLEAYLRRPPPEGAPSHAAALWRLGMVKEHAGEPAAARALYKQALERDPQMQGAREALDRLRGAGHAVPG
jgi:hypothetical protein